jgi:excinuclease ABC subunit A
MEDKIIIKGARVHNLKNIDLEIPKEKLVVFTGVSGSGKSSLAFDTIFAEGQRRYIESLSPYARQFLGQMERADVDEIIGLSPAIAINQKALSHNPRSTVGTLTEIYDYLRVLFSRLGEVYCPNDGSRIKKLAIDEIIEIIKNTAKEHGHEYLTVFAPVVRGRKGEYYQLLYDFLNLGFTRARIDSEFKDLHEKIVLSRYKQHTIEILIDKVLLTDEPRIFEAVETALNHSQGLVNILFDEQKENQREILLSSKWTCPKCNLAFPELEPRLFSFNSPHGACEMCGGLGKTDLLLKTICPSCRGKRLKPEALSVLVHKRTIFSICDMTLDKIFAFFADYKKSLSERDQQIASAVLKEICDRLEFLLQVGVDYLTLTREAETLSGGEAQRIRLASQIGTRLSNTLYVLDEPTIGLHERDTNRLIKTLEALRDQHNSVLVVEHDETTIHQSDYLVDLGPMAGVCGGKVVAEGEVNKLLAANNKQQTTKTKGQSAQSLTLQYLRGRKKIAVPKRREKITEKLHIEGARAHNLKNISCDIPLRKLVCVTGVSGSGKSSFLHDVVYKNAVHVKNHMPGGLETASRISGTEYLNNIVMVDQSPIGRTPRSNPATYTGIWTPIRDLFASLEEARARNYTATRFSFNVAASRGGGRCEACEGAGFNLIEMHFLPPVEVECEICHGRRFSKETLQVKYGNLPAGGRGKNIAEVLAMTVDEAAGFFDGIYTITDKLKVLKEVGLGYIRLGQSATTLSGGEAQRIKLSKELIGPLGKRTLYLLDEPTVGLHYYDVEMLLKVLNKLIDKGNSVVVIEHNMHVIKSCDYVIDLGPEGGEAGGKLIAKGTPEQVAQIEKSYTGKYLREYLA